MTVVLPSDNYCRKCLDIEILRETCRFSNSVGSHVPTRNYFEVEVIDFAPSLLLAERQPAILASQTTI